MEGSYNIGRLVTECHVYDSKKCLEWCQSIGLLPQSKQCSKCRRNMTIVTQESDTSETMSFRCSNCRKKVSLYDGTVFSDARIPIGQILMILYCFAHKFSYEDTIHEARFSTNELSDHTISRWFQVGREAAINYVEDTNEEGKMGGEGSVIEIDESMVGKRKFNKGRWVNGTWLIGFTDIHTGELRILECPDNKRDSITLLPLIRHHIKRGTTIITDCWGGYNELEQFGYNHLTVNHSDPDNPFINQKTGANTQTIESAWRAMKRRICRGGVSKEELPAHLCEYLWHRYTKKKKLDAFVHLIKLLIQMKRA